MNRLKPYAHFFWRFIHVAKNLREIYRNDRAVPTSFWGFHRHLANSWFPGRPSRQPSATVGRAAVPGPQPGRPPAPATDGRQSSSPEAAAFSGAAPEAPGAGGGGSWPPFKVPIRWWGHFLLEQIPDAQPPVWGHGFIGTPTTAYKLNGRLIKFWERELKSYPKLLWAICITLPNPIKYKMTAFQPT